METFDLSSVAAPRVPRSRAYCSLPGRIALRATSSTTAASASSRVGSLLLRCWLTPLRMVAVLQASGRIAADGLDVGVRIGGVQDVLIGWRNSERGKAPLLCRGDGFAVRLEIAEAAAVPLSPDRQFGRADVFQPEPFQELGRGGRERGLIGRYPV